MDVSQRSIYEKKPALTKEDKAYYDAVVFSMLIGKIFTAENEMRYCC